MPDGSGMQGSASLLICLENNRLLGNEISAGSKRRRSSRVYGCDGNKCCGQKETREQEREKLTHLTSRTHGVVMVHVDKLAFSFG